MNDVSELASTEPVLPPKQFAEGGEAHNPEFYSEGGLKEFVAYVKNLSKYLGKKAFLKNDVRNNFVPSIGFSDDDIRNVQHVSKHFKDDPENILKVYSTAGGKKSRFS